MIIHKPVLTTKQSPPTNDHTLVQLYRITVANTLWSTELIFGTFLSHEVLIYTVRLGEA